LASLVDGTHATATDETLDCQLWKMGIEFFYLDR
jgi:hypothetical protein